MFSENQKFYLKRLAALHDFKNGRKAVYLQQKKEKTWAAYDLPNTRAVDASAGLLMYHGKQYKDLEGIVADVLDIHQDAGAVMFINNSRIASGLPAFVTLDNAEAMGSIPGDKEHRQIVNVRDYLTVYGIDYDDVDVMQPERAWMTTEVSLEVPDTAYADTRTECVPVDEDSEMGAYYEALLEAGRNLLMEDHRKIKWGDMSTAPDPLFKEMLTKNSEKQNQQSSGSGNGKPGNSGFGLPQNSQGQQNGSNGQSDPNQNGNGSQNGSGNAQNNSSNGNGNGKSVGSMTAEQLSEALKEAVKQIEQAAKNVGVNNLPDRHSNSITNQASKSKDAKKRESGKQGSGNNANGNGNGNSNSIANAPGANSGKSDLSAAKCDIKAIEKARKQEIATAQANNEANNQLAQEGAKIGSEIGTKISVRRAAEVPQSNIDTYNRLSAGLL